MRFGFGFIFGAEADASELFGIFAFDIFVKGADLVHVSAKIIRGDERRAEATDLFFVIEESKDDRDMGFFGDEVKARFPIIDIFSGAFGGDAEDQSVGFFELFGGRGDDVVVGAAVDGNPPHPAHKPAVREAKQRVFSHPRDLDIKIHRHQDHIEKVPVGCMRSGDQDHLFTGESAFGLPSHEFE